MEKDSAGKWTEVPQTETFKADTEYRVEVYFNKLLGCDYTGLKKENVTVNGVEADTIFVTVAISGLRMRKANLRLQIKQVLSYRQVDIHFQMYRQRMPHVQKRATRHTIFVTVAISGLRMRKANLRLQIKQVLSYRHPVIRFQIGKLMITVTGMNVNVDTKRMLHNTVLNGW